MRRSNLKVSVLLAALLLVSVGSFSVRSAAQTQSNQNNWSGSAIPAPTGLVNNDCVSAGVSRQPFFPYLTDSNNVSFDGPCWSPLTGSLWFARSAYATTPGFDAAITAQTSANYQSDSVNQRDISFLAVPGTKATETGNILALIGFDVFGPTHRGTGTIGVAIGFNAEMNFGTYPAALVGGIDTIQSNGPGRAYRGTGTTRGLVIDGYPHTQGPNVGIDIGTASNDFPNSTDFGIRENATTAQPAGIRNQLGPIGQVAARTWAGVTSCTTSTFTVTMTKLKYNSTPVIIVSDETTSGGARVSAKSATSFSVACTGASDVVDWATFGNPN